MRTTDEDPAARSPWHRVYEIRVEGHLMSYWSKWFDGLAVTLEDDGNTVLSGVVPDQAALHGLLAKVRDLGLPLISVRRADDRHSTKP